MGVVVFLALGAKERVERALRRGGITGQREVFGEEGQNVCGGLGLVLVTERACFQLRKDYKRSGVSEEYELGSNAIFRKAIAIAEQIDRDNLLRNRSIAHVSKSSSVISAVGGSW